MGSRSASRLRWRCRRGTRELDMVLLRFLEEAYPGLGADEQEAFEALLSAQDPELAAWILGGEEPPPQWRAVVGRIRAQWGWN